MMGSLGERFCGRTKEMTKRIGKVAKELRDFSPRIKILGGGMIVCNKRLRLKGSVIKHGPRVKMRKIGIGMRWPTQTKQDTVGVAKAKVYVG